MIETHIRALLAETNFVMLPEFGGLTAHEAPATVDSEHGQILPARKIPEFNEALKDTPSELPAFIASREGISEDEATDKVGKFIGELKNALAAGERFRIEEVGYFKLNPEGEPVFEPWEHSNYLDDSYGLPPVETQRIERTVGEGYKSQKAPEPPKTPKSAKNKAIKGTPEPEAESGEEEGSKVLVYVAVALTLLLVVASSLFWYSKMSKKQSPEMAAAAPADSASTSAESTAAVEPVETGAAGGSHKKKHHAEPFSTAPKHEHKFYIAAGAFKSGDNAFNLRKKLLAEGNPDAEVLEPQGKRKLYVVSVAEAETEAEAKALRKQLQPKFPGTQLVIIK